MDLVVAFNAKEAKGNWRLDSDEDEGSRVVFLQERTVPQYSDQSSGLTCCLGGPQDPQEAGPTQRLSLLPAHAGVGAVSSGQVI